MGRRRSSAFEELLILPAALLFGAVASFFKQGRSIELIASVRSPSGREVNSLSWQEFERLIGEEFRQRGFEVTEQGGSALTAGLTLS